MDTPQTLIALHGVAGSGKSLASDHLWNGHGFATTKFAGPLKGMLRMLLIINGVKTTGEIDRYIEGDLKEVPSDYFGGKTPRYLMQTLGTEWGRELIADDLWLSTWKNGVQSMGEDSVVVDDCRFENEATLVRSMGGRVIHIKRPDPDRDPGVHSSEVELEVKPQDLVIWNTGTKQELYDKIDLIVDAIR